MQEHEYKARDKTVQKMSRDGLREENLRNKEEKRITGRDMDTEVSRSEKKDELDFSKRRREHINEKRETEHPEQSSKKTRYGRESVLDEESEQDIDGELDGEQVADESAAATKSAFRSESIRGQPRGERAYLETVADSRDLRKKKMVRYYASKERRKEKEASEESKTAKREAARYRETSEVAEESLDGFSEEIKGKSKRERVLKEQRKKIGMIFQHFNLLDRSTVFDNIAYPLKYSGKSKTQIRERVHELLELVDLKDKENVYPSQLSGGQKQRVAIARAIAAQPPVILADEPTGNLDSASSREILAILKKMHKSGRTVILITHDNGIAAQARRVVRIMDGKIESDTINEDFDQEAEA